MIQQKNIIEKLKESGLTGRGGAGFPTWKKWEAVKNAKAVSGLTDGQNNTEGRYAKKYIICNASEGEPMVFKDKYILEKYPEDLVYGIKIALETISDSFAYIYLNHQFFQQFKTTLEKLTKDLPITLFEKTGGYLTGEETTLLNVIEGKGPEPRLKPPYPTESGLWGKPTLINNVETFYWVGKIAKNEYKGDRFYSIEGEVKNRGVFELPENLTVEQILRQTNNYPDPSTILEQDFFVQAGGGIAGEILLATELNKPLKGAGAILLFNKADTDVLSLMRSWADFFVHANCDKCVPCREGTFRIKEILAKEKLNEIDKEKINEILDALQKTSFCPLGRMAAVPFKSAFSKLL